MAAILVPSLVKLRSDFNALNPERDKASDGWIGDRAHATNESDHNPDESGNTPYEDADSTDEVHAIDVDKTGPWRHPQTGATLSFGGVVERIRRQHERGEDNRLQNIIWNGKIASRSWGWDWRTYNGSNQHKEHAHFSARYTTAQENDTSSYNLYERVASNVTTPTADQMKAAATAGVLGYVGGGLPSWAEQPANRNFLNTFAELFREVKEQDTDLDVVSVSLVGITSMLASIITEPEDMDNPEQHPIVRAVRYAMSNPPA